MSWKKINDTNIQYMLPVNKKFDQNLTYIKDSNATVFVMLILIGWRRNFHGIKSTFDAAGETLHLPRFILYFKYIKTKGYFILLY